MTRDFKAYFIFFYFRAKRTKISTLSLMANTQY